MTTMLLPDIAKSSLRPLDEAVAREGPDLNPGIPRVLADTTLFVAGVIGELWQRQIAELNKGMEGRALLVIVDGFLDCLRTAERVVERISHFATVGGDEARGVRATLAKASAEVMRLKREVTDLHDRLSAPPPPGLLDRCREAVSKTRDEDYVSGDEILARLQAGEDI